MRRICNGKGSTRHQFVSHDRDFNVLKEIKFPKVKVIQLDGFKAILSTPNK